MKIKPVTPRLPEKTLEWVSTMFRNPTYGAGYSIEAFHTLYARAFHDLKGRFTSPELSLMIDVFNGTMLTPGMAGQHLLIQCVDGMALDSLDEKLGVDRESFTTKLQSLTLTESNCLEIWANGYWYGGKSGVDLEKYVSKLTE